MSSHPYGLRGDPFASPATLSAKDASRLIRRRVRAFNGDGGTLFPIETCDLIHEIEGGIPDAMLALAGRAMRIAADQGAPAVLPPHVRQAAGSAPTTGPTTQEGATGSALSPAEARGDADEAVDQEAFGSEPATTDEIVTTRAEIPTRAQIAARAQAVLAWEEEPAIADDDPDLPAFHPAAFALPNQPSEALDSDARDWVSRFIIPSAGVGYHADESARAAHAPAGRPAAASAPARRSAPAPAPVSDGDAVESALAAAYGHAAPRRSALPRRPRRRRRSGGHGVLIAVAAVCAVVFIIRMSVRGNLLPPAREPQRPVQTAARRDDPPPSAPAAPRAEPTTRVTADREPEPAVVPPATTVIDEPLIGPHSAAQQRLSTSPAMTATGTPPESAVPVRREVSYGKFGLEVATFIFEERARVERDRLVANGLRARLITTVEYGSRVYRVVVGGFADPAAAERAADSLLSNGMVLQARVIRNH